MVPLLRGLPPPSSPILSIFLPLFKLFKCSNFRASSFNHQVDCNHIRISSELTLQLLPLPPVWAVLPRRLN